MCTGVSLFLLDIFFTLIYSLVGLLVSFVFKLDFLVSFSLVGKELSVVWSALNDYFSA